MLSRLGMERWYAMKPETSTREKLLAAAKAEFLDKGYASASLRNICKKAEVTTGALYFFFQDKEDLFGSLVKEPLEKIYKLMKEHYNSELTRPLTLSDDFEDDITAALMVVDFMFRYHDEFVLLLLKSKGSKYENCTDDFVEISEKHYHILVERISKNGNYAKIDDYIIHWTAHLQIFSFVQLIEHGLSREEALKHIRSIVNFLISGWYGTFQRIPQ